MTMFDINPRAAARLELLKIANGDIAAAERMVAFLNGPAVEDTAAAAACPFKPMDSAPKDGRPLLLSDGEAVWIAQWRETRTINMITGKEEADQRWWKIQGIIAFDPPTPTAWAPLPAPKAFPLNVTVDAGAGEAA